MSILLRLYKNELNLFIVLVLLINAFAPLSFAFSNPSQENTTELEELFGEKIIICTPFGYKYVSIDKLQDSQIPSDDEQLLHCSFCAINMAGAMVYVPEERVFYHFTYKKQMPITFFGSDVNFINSEATNTISPRAPPVFS